MESQAYAQFRDGVGLGAASAFWPGPGVEFADRTLLVTGHGNVGYVWGDEGAVMIDTGTPQVFGDHAVRELRRFTDVPIRIVIYTHGHIDHAFNLAPVLADADAQGYPRPRVVAHPRVLARFARYDRLRGHTTLINRINFGTPPDTPIVPDFCYPDTLVEAATTLQVGNLLVGLRPGIGETDDALWVWVPERRVLFPGDFLLWGFPNIGNPFKVQRYATGWAQALEEMAGLHATAAGPGHGPAVVGEGPVQEMLLDTARALRHLDEEVVRRLNAGQAFEQILAEVKLPADLKEKPYLAPIYGSPTYTVHALLREYAGWYDYNPSHLHPSPTTEIAAEVVSLAGGAGRLLKRARALAADNPQLALHLVDFVADGEEEEMRREALDLKASLLKTRAGEMDSFISYNILDVGARLIRERLAS
jgi:alkyl sulfatase BDS1-like metallo-beta-lactamase superfamily hydrolase